LEKIQRLDDARLLGSLVEGFLPWVLFTYVIELQVVGCNSPIVSCNILYIIKSLGTYLGARTYLYSMLVLCVLDVIVPCILFFFLTETVNGALY
jgi:hypothetical protein